MRNAETILNVIRERGRRGLPLERVYRLLFNRDLYLRAYARLYRNDGAMTPGATAETVDAMSLAKIDTIIDTIRRDSMPGIWSNGVTTLRSAAYRKARWWVLSSVISIWIGWISLLRRCYCRPTIRVNVENRIRSTWRSSMKRGENGL